MADARAKALQGSVPGDAFDVAVEHLSREARRSRRKREVRSHTINAKRITKRELAIGAALYPEDTQEGRPRTRGECDQVERPCPYVGCRHHLYLEITGSAGIKLNFPDLEPDELLESCSLDVADEGGLTLEQAAELLNVTRERLRQVEVLALGRLAATNAGSGLVDPEEHRRPVRAHAPVLRVVRDDEDDEEFDADLLQELPDDVERDIEGDLE